MISVGVIHCHSWVGRSGRQPRFSQTWRPKQTIKGGRAGGSARTPGDPARATAGGCTFDLKNYEVAEPSLVIR